MGKLLEVKNLKTYFYTEDGVVKAVDGVSFHVNEGETLGLVGESGCGKSQTSLSVMRLISHPGKIVDGEIYFNGQNLLALSDDEMRKIRGNDISMIFQEPMSSLNPVFTVGYQISESLMLHQGLSKEEARKKAVEMLRLVGIPEPEKRVDEYPHQMSGGMRQRVMIAIALSCNPKLLIADEPTTALDVTIQAQILDLMRDLRRKFNTSIIMITHDLAVIAEMADRVIVMYTGKIVEEAPVRQLFKNPGHPYTQGLINSIPKLHVESERLEAIGGTVPNPLNLPPGCRFANRCKYARDICRQKEPPIIEIESGHRVACWLHCAADEGVTQ